MRLGSYREDESGAAREILSVPAAAGSTLVIDRLAETHTDARLVGRLEADEPQQNARILTTLYLADPSRGRCRPVSAEDFKDAPCAGIAREPLREEPLLDADGVLYRIREVSEGARAALRWTRCTPGEGEHFEVLTLRDVVGHLRDYEPARGLTVAALDAHPEDAPVSARRLREEVERLESSCILLNDRLREVVLQRVARGDLSMSEIAMRCGRLKRDRRGNVSGETSWLARRIGEKPEGGESEPTPWVHSDVLALIAREGLGTYPSDLEPA
ncbi:MAG TPA: hypothetical protein VFV03_00335 [Solirubrobacteraceae bacterium]|nr:hypothetical protein [Solirubrobacteraceae bacterium]